MKIVCPCSIVCFIALFVSCFGQSIAYGQQHGLGVAPGEEGQGEIFLTPDFSYKKPVSVAILPFENDTGDEDLDWLSKGIPENSISKFTASASIRLIDSGQIKSILDQLGLSSSDLADPENALNVGKLLAAEIIVGGSYQKRPGDNLKIMGRFTDVVTGTILKAVEISGAQKDMDHLMEQTSRELVMAVDPDIHLTLHPVLKPRSRANAALKSVVWPGWGDLPDRKISGILMGVLELSTLAMSVVFHYSYEDKLDEYEEVREKLMDIENFSTYVEYDTQHELAVSKREKAVDSRTLRDVIFLSAVVGLRIVGALESAVFLPGASKEESDVVTSTTDGAVLLSWRRSF